MIEVRKNNETGRPHTFRFLDTAVSFSLCFWVDAHVVNGAALQLKRKQEKGKEKSLFAFPAPPYHLASAFFSALLVGYRAGFYWLLCFCWLHSSSVSASTGLSLMAEYPVL